MVCNQQRAIMKEVEDSSLQNHCSFLIRIIEEGILEMKTECSAKDLVFLACVGFCVITFEPIMI